MHGFNSRDRLHNTYEVPVPSDIDPRLLKVQKTLAKKFGQESASIVSTATTRSKITTVLPTGIPVLDEYVIGCGGLPTRRISELYGGEGDGKTSLAYAICASAQKAGAVVGWCDSEHAFDMARAQSFGMDPKAALLMDPYTLEESLNQQLEFLRALDDGGAPVLLVWDSLSGAPPQAALDGNAGDKAVAERARLLSVNVPAMLALCVKKNAHWLVINQLREKIGVMYGDNTTTPGGRTLKYFASIRLRIYGGKAIKAGEADNQIGKMVTISGVKSRWAPAYRKARLRWLFKKGYDLDWSLVNHFKSQGLVSGRDRNALDKARELAAQERWEGDDAQGDSSGGDADDDE